MARQGITPELFEYRGVPKSERRIGPRRPLVVRQVRLEASHEIFFGYATNLSAGGLFIQTPNPKPQGTEVVVRFNLPGDEHAVQCRAVVVWRREYHSESSTQAGMGVKFVDVAEEDAKRIEAFVSEDSDSIQLT